MGAMALPGKAIAPVGRSYSAALLRTPPILDRNRRMDHPP